MILIFTLIGACLTTITYDSGTSRDLDTGTFYDPNNYKIVKITFVGTFSKTPKIILVPEKYNLHHGGTSFELQTQSITVTGFEIYMKCTAGQVQGLVYHWYAVDDPKVEVINQFNIIDYSPKEFSHSNPQATQGFISILNFGFVSQTYFDFEVKISSITSSKVNIQITDPSNLNGNLLMLGYQIILTTPEIFNLVGTFTTSATFTSSNIPLVQNAFYMFPFSYFKRQAPTNNNIRFNITYQSTNPIQYKLENWYGAYLINTHKQIWIYQTFRPLKCKNLRISQNYNPLLSIPDSIPYLHINENNLLYNQVGTFNAIFNTNILEFTMIISISCPCGKKLKSSFMQCPDCSASNQMKTQYHFCNQNVNQMTYSPKYEQIQEGNEQITIEVTATSIKMSQIITNQAQSSSILFYIQQVDL